MKKHSYHISRLYAIYFFNSIGKWSIFARQNEIVFRQPAHGMRPDLDPGLTVVFQMQIGMMALFLGQLRDAIEKIHARQEILHLPVLANAQAIARDSPPSRARICSLIVFAASSFGTSPSQAEHFLADNSSTVQVLVKPSFNAQGSS